MKPQTALMIRVLMNHYYQGAPEAFLQGLTPENAKMVMSLTTTSHEPQQALAQPIKALGNTIHFSWLRTPLQKFSKPMQSLLLGALPEEVSKALCAHTQNPPAITQLHDIAKPYFLALLYRQLGAEAVIPPAFLPTTAVGFLLSLSKTQLVQLIDFLGLYDLAEELRLIVDTKQLKKIYANLNSIKQQFLRIAMHQKEKISSVPIGLRNWRGDATELNAMLHRRGLMRLGYALAGQHPDFIWHLTHRLDSGRGEILNSHYSKKEIPTITSILLQQILATNNFLTKQKAA